MIIQDEQLREFEAKTGMNAEDMTEKVEKLRDCLWQLSDITYESNDGNGTIFKRFTETQKQVVLNLLVNLRTEVVRVVSEGNPLRVLELMTSLPQFEAQHLVQVIEHELSKKG